MASKTRFNNYFIAVVLVTSVWLMCNCFGQDCDEHQTKENGLIQKTNCTGRGVHVTFSQCCDYWNETVRKGDVVAVTLRNGGNKSCCGGILVNSTSSINYIEYLLYSADCCNATIVDILLPFGKSVQRVQLDMFAQDISNPSKPTYDFKIVCTYEHSINESGNGTVINGGGHPNNTGNNTGNVNGTGAVILQVNTPDNFAKGDGDDTEPVNIGDLLELRIGLNKSDDSYSNILPYFCAFSSKKDVTDNPIAFVQYGCPDTSIDKTLDGIFKNWNATEDFKNYSMEFQAFAFENDKGTLDKLYIHCLINLCINNADGTTDCNATTECIDNSVDKDQWHVTGSSYSYNIESNYQYLLSRLQSGKAKNGHVIKSASVPVITNPSKGSKVWYIVIGVVGGLLVVSLITIGLLLVLRGPWRTRYLEKQIQGDTRWVFPFHIPRARLDPSTVPSSQGSIISDGGSSVSRGYGKF